MDLCNLTILKASQGLKEKRFSSRELTLSCLKKIEEVEDDLNAFITVTAEEALTNGKGNDGIYCGASIALKEGAIITGKNSSLLHAGSSLVLNATKHLAGLPDNLHLIPENVISSLAMLKKEILQGKGISLDVDETLIALTISSLSNPAAQMAVERLKELRGCEVHLTHIPTPGDEAGLRKLGVNLTSDPDFSSRSLFIN